MLPGCALLILSLGLNACHNIGQNGNTNINGQVSMHSAYDDSTLHQTKLPVLMPFNRIIDPAGTVLRYGSPERENHTLDEKLIPGTDLLAVEDRFGISVINISQQKTVARWEYSNNKAYKGVVSTYSGIDVWQAADGNWQLFWSAANGSSKQSYVMQASWSGNELKLVKSLAFKPEGESPLALPNEVLMLPQNGVNYLYVVLNGNNKLVKVNWDKQAVEWSKPSGVTPYDLAAAGDNIYVSNWGGPQPPDSTRKETAGVPYGKAYVDPHTGAINRGSITVYNRVTGKVVAEIETGLHPNDMITSADKKLLYVANGNSDNVMVINTATNKVIETINLQLNPGEKGFIGDTPNGLALSADGRTLYVANGLDNAVAVVNLGKNGSANGSGSSKITGFIPTEAYPCGVVVKNNTLVVTNLEGEGARVNSKDIKHGAGIPNTEDGAFNSHHQLATLSFIPVPDEAGLKAYTDKVKQLNLLYRAQLARQIPRKDVAPVPVPERIGEPSVFKHVIYIIKENRTYDQILGDMPEGDGRADLCLYGNTVTPNEHKLAREFLLLDNYYASGKCSAEGHQWTDAAMATDYLERNIQAWFRSYPHVQTDAMVYNKKGFIWNNAVDNGISTRIYGEAATPHFKKGTTWTQIYNDYKAGKKFDFYNTTTISRVKPLLAPDYPGFDSHEINDQLRASVFIRDLNAWEQKPGDEFPQFIMMALPADHTGGTRPGLPTPRAAIADNDLAVGRIIEALSKSRFWKNTVVFVTEDDSQAGWDHVSAYRTTGFVFSPYSKLKQTVHTNYNQTCIVRTIEQILGLQPMNIIDATALPMFSCFGKRPDNTAFEHVPNTTPLDELNPKLSALKGKPLYYAKQSMRPEFDHVDGGNDDMLNKILWYNVKGTKPYPQKLAGQAMDDDD